MASSSADRLPPILCVVGARPNFMKMAPILAALSRRPEGNPALLVHTGQHFDQDMSDRLFSDLGLPRPDIHLEVGSASHAVTEADRSHLRKREFSRHARRATGR